MPSEESSRAAERTHPAFVVATSVWATAFLIWFVVVVAMAPKGKSENALFILALVPIMGGAGWVQRSRSGWMLLRRTLATHLRDQATRSCQCARYA